MVRNAIGITASNRIFEMTILRPIISAATKTSAKRYPPLPSFQLQDIESGNAIIAKRIGLEMIKIPKIRFQFCIIFNLKNGK
jgi:hypothetical protein